MIADKHMMTDQNLLRRSQDTRRSATESETNFLYGAQTICKTSDKSFRKVTSKIRRDSDLKHIHLSTNILHLYENYLIDPKPRGGGI